MTRRGDLAIVLDALVAAEPEAAIAHCRAMRTDLDDTTDGYVLALESFACFMAARFDEAAESAEAALRHCAPDDAVLRSTARAARALAHAGRPFEQGLAAGWSGTAPAVSASGDPLLDAVADLPELEAAAHGVDADLVLFARYLVAEAAIASARLLLAESALAAAPPDLTRFLVRDEVAHPFGLVLGILRVRVLTFRGRVAEAIEAIAQLPASTGVLLVQLRSATEILVRGNAAERAQVRALADSLVAESPVPRDYLTRGCFVLAAFGLVALGDVRASARFALAAGGDLAVSRLTTVDRALCLELLVAAAADEGDPDAAEAWSALARPLIDDPIAASTVYRIFARTALLAGEPDAALAAAERALELASAEGRAVEAAEAEVLAARARREAQQVDSGSARLIALAAASEITGHRAARNAAVRELRASGRRLPPVAGAGWSGLSAREREVAVMMADGLRNTEIAAALHLSEHTVRGHVSRVLAAFGAATRFVVAARMAELFPGDVAVPVAPLTPQLSAVAVRVAAGLGNAEIGRELGLGTKTVEKYVAEIQRRWGAGSRVAIARLVRSIPGPGE
ncbi:LuxR C-terminal-related transcriptional regulator [Microcella sp.]|uniref:LuxR C-terminal-related transcriptional regulator n=1 Tax=Microcella sp. TaxID=1913979 RepID=UPI00391C1A0D